MIGSLACGIRDTATIYKALLILALFHSFSHKVSYSFTHWVPCKVAVSSSWYWDL